MLYQLSYTPTSAETSAYTVPAAAGQAGFGIASG